MSPLSVSLILLAAVVHAVWNILAKGIRGNGTLFVWWYGLVSSVVLIPVSLLEPGAWQSWGWPLVGAAVVSGLLHTVYGTALQTGYDRAPLGVVYAVARGTGPVSYTHLDVYKRQVLRSDGHRRHTGPRRGAPSRHPRSSVRAAGARGDGRRDPPPGGREGGGPQRLHPLLLRHAGRPAHGVRGGHRVPPGRRGPASAGGGGRGLRPPGPGGHRAAHAPGHHRPGAGGRGAARHPVLARGHHPGERGAGHRAGRGAHTARGSGTRAAAAQRVHEGPRRTGCLLYTSRCV